MVVSPQSFSSSFVLSLPSHFPSLDPMCVVFISLLVQNDNVIIKLKEFKRLITVGK